MRMFFFVLPLVFIQSIARAQAYPLPFGSPVISAPWMLHEIYRQDEERLEAIKGGSKDESTRRSSERPRIAFSPTADATKTSTASKLAASYPPDQRIKVTRTFNELLVGYHQIESKFDVPKYDLGGSVAALLAGSYMAYRNVDFPDEAFKPLVQQMQRALSGNAQLVAAPNAEKQDMYEQLAILGMLMANTQIALQQQPNAKSSQNLRAAAKGYLETFLKTDAERVQITDKGLVIK